MQGGEFAASILPAWRNCTRYYLVDAWQPLANYTDQSNVDRWRQVELFESARARMRRFRRRTLALFLPMLTSQALLLVPDGSVDLVYVDARHDYCGVLADVRGWWPKLRPGGIMAGHDYLTVAESRALNPKQDWGLCGDGTRHEGAVKAAVQGFAAEQGGLDIMVTKDDVWPTWMVQKRRERGAAAK